MVKRTAFAAVFALTTGLLVSTFNNCSVPFQPAALETELASQGLPPPGAPSGIDSDHGPSGFDPVTGLPQTKACEAAAVQEPSASAIRRLTRSAYLNTLRDLLAPAEVNWTSGDTAILASMLPHDNDGLGFDGLDRALSFDHLDAYNQMAAYLAKLIGANAYRLTKLVNCGQGKDIYSSACVDHFIKGFGQRVTRRPLSAEETAEMRKFFDETVAASDAPTGYQFLLMRFLQSPHLLYHLETGGTPVNGRADLVQITPYELASRLSYLFWNTLPDDELFAAAADGTLLTDAGLAKQVERLFNSPKAKSAIFGRFYAQWLKLEKLPGLEGLRDTAFPVIKPWYNTDNHTFLRSDAIQELRDLSNHLTFDTKGGYRDLMTTDLSFARLDSVHPDREDGSAFGYGKTSLLPKIYNVAAWAPGSPPQRITSGAHNGILTRFALLVSGENTTSPIRRGVFVRRQILCDILPSPDINALPDRSLEPPESSPTLTTRERFEQKTSAPACMGCHAMINPIGNVLEEFSPVGQIRSQEEIWNWEVYGGAKVASLPVNATDMPRIEMTDNTPVTGGAALGRLIAEGSKGPMCFTRQWFRYALSRFESADDGCMVSEINARMTSQGGSIQDMMKATVLHPSFRLRKVKQ